MIRYRVVGSSIAIGGATRGILIYINGKKTPEERAYKIFLKRQKQDLTQHTGILIIRAKEDMLGGKIDVRRISDGAAIRKKLVHVNHRIVENCPINVISLLDLEPGSYSVDFIPPRSTTSKGLRYSAEVRINPKRISELDWSR